MNSHLANQHLHYVGLKREAGFLGVRGKIVQVSLSPMKNMVVLVTLRIPMLNLFTMYPLESSKTQSSTIILESTVHYLVK